MLKNDDHDIATTWKRQLTTRTRNFWATKPSPMTCRQLLQEANAERTGYLWKAHFIWKGSCPLPNLNLGGRHPLKKDTCGPNHRTSHYPLEAHAGVGELTVRFKSRSSFIALFTRFQPVPARFTIC